jgi:hypothetical protein
MAQAFDSWSISLRFRLFKNLILEPQAELFDKIVAPRRVLLQVRRNEPPEERFIILNPDGAVRYISTADAESDTEPIGGLSAAIQEFEKTYRKEYAAILGRIAFTEYKPNNHKFDFKVSTNKTDVRGRTLSFFQKLPLEQLAREVHYDTLDAKQTKDLHSVGIDAYLRASPSVSYLLPEYRNIIMRGGGI